MVWNHRRSFAVPHELPAVELHRSGWCSDPHLATQTSRHEVLKLCDCLVKGFAIAPEIALPRWVFFIERQAMFELPLIPEGLCRSVEPHGQDPKRVEKRPDVPTLTRSHPKNLDARLHGYNLVTEFVDVLSKPRQNVEVVKASTVVRVDESPAVGVGEKVAHQLVDASTFCDGGDFPGLFVGPRSVAKSPVPTPIKNTTQKNASKARAL